MKVSEVYPSNFIAAGDLDGRPVTLTVKSVSDKNTVKRQDGQKINKMVIYWDETPRALICGPRNAKRVRTIHGNDTSKWLGKKVTIFPTTIDMTKAAAEQAGCIILKEHGKMVTVPSIMVSISAAGISTEPPELS